MDKELFDMLNKLTEKKLKDDDKMEFSHNIGDLISKSEKSIILMSDSGVASLGRGIDVLPTIAMCLTHLIKEKFPERKVWEKIFNDILEESFNEEEGEDEQNVNGLLLNEEDFNKLSDKEKLEHLDKVLETLKKLNGNK